MQRYVCVHGHFYQPPREDPWLEAVEQQDAASPFHDWNDRITAECYEPNTRARILDDQGRISGLVNNYARMSFNIGPTLLAWMKDAAPTTYAGILESDRRSAERFGGHGSAMAQVYGHAILPLADTRDRRTQILWGVTDFRSRFGRDPVGMWLAETAVDDESLDLMAEAGIAFTILSPYQAARVRGLGEESWRDVRGGHVDPTQPYLVRLPSGRSIAVFFYDGPISQGIAFEGLLGSADRFERRLLEGFGDRDGPQLAHVATDGESYGHHHRHGEMALAATMLRLEQRDDVEVTNYAQFLERHPPTAEAEVVQASSWSCSHGVERWRSDCGCGSESGLHQRWRAPLRAALDELRQGIAERFEQGAGALLTDPWAARDDYLEVVLDRDGALAPFLARHASRPLEDDEISRAVQFLELQRYALLMYTSCGWFFDELSRPEPVQVLRYAARAIQLLRELTGDDLEPRFLDLLAAAESNDARHRDGRAVYEHLVRPAVTDLEQVGAHYAISSMVRDYEDLDRIGAYEIHREDHELRAAGRAQLAFGRMTVRSVVTLTQRQLEFAVFHLGDHNFVCGVRPRGDDEAFDAMRHALEQPFDVADLPAVIRAIDDHLGQPQYSLGTLFRDEKRRILDLVLETTIDEVEASYLSIYRNRAPLMRFLTELGTTLPPSLHRAAEVVLHAELTRELATSATDPHHVASLLEEADRFGVSLDTERLAHTASATVARMAHRVGEHVAGDGLRFSAFDDDDAATLARAEALLEVVSLVPFEVDLSPAQDVLWRALRDHRDALAGRARDGDDDAARWLDELARFATAVGVVVPAPTTTA